MSKRKATVFLIASVLKTWDDHRMFEKWAIFFSEEFQVKPHIFGFPSIDFSSEDVSFHASMKEKTPLNRMKSFFRFVFLLFKLRPDVVVIETFELLLPSYIFSLLGFKQVKLFYDIRENYWLNLKSQNSKNSLFKTFGLMYINAVESLSIFFIKHFFITEAIYAKQLSFLVKGNHSLMENLYSFKGVLNLEKEPNTYLVAGTLSKAYGIDLACEWMLKIKQNNPCAKFLILGHQTDEFVFPDSIKAIADLQVSKKPIAHYLILEAIAKAETLLLAYHWSESFIGCTPAKLYEALHLGTKVICSYEENLANKLKNSNIQFVSKDFEVLTTLSINCEAMEINSIDFENEYYAQLQEVFSRYL